MNAIWIVAGGWLLLAGAVAIWLGKAIRYANSAVQPKIWVVPDDVDGLYDEVDQ
jgi:hypothetical protein